MEAIANAAGTTKAYRRHGIALDCRTGGQRDGVLLGQKTPRGALPVTSDKKGTLSIYPRPTFTELGGVSYYGIDQLDSYRRAATYVDRILKGEKPSGLPVQTPVKFELVINLKTAKALGLNIPVALQQRADELIE